MEISSSTTKCVFKKKKSNLHNYKVITTLSPPSLLIQPLFQTTFENEHPSYHRTFSAVFTLFRPPAMHYITHKQLHHCHFNQGQLSYLYRVSTIQLSLHLTHTLKYTFPLYHAHTRMHKHTISQTTSAHTQIHTAPSKTIL